MYVLYAWKTTSIKPVSRILWRRSPLQFFILILIYFFFFVNDRGRFTILVNMARINLERVCYVDVCLFTLGLKMIEQKKKKNDDKRRYCILLTTHAYATEKKIENRKLYFCSPEITVYKTFSRNNRTSYISINTHFFLLLFRPIKRRNTVLYIMRASININRIFCNI